MHLLHHQSRASSDGPMDGGIHDDRIPGHAQKRQQVQVRGMGSSINLGPGTYLMPDKGQGLQL